MPLFPAGNTARKKDFADTMSPNSAGTMAYEIFYAVATTSTFFERASFFVWFALDLTFATVAVTSAYAPSQQKTVAKRIFVGVLVGLLILWTLTRMFPDEREQVTAYWTGLLLQFPIGWGSLYLLLKQRHTKGHSLEIW